MSLIAQIPINNNSTRVRYPSVRFSAPLGAGIYDFGIPANTDIQLMELQANSVYCIERINFFAQAAEADWLESMRTPLEFPSFFLRYQNEPNPSQFAEGVQCVNYIDNMEQLVFFRQTREQENLLISFRGVVDQVAGMVGFDPLLCEVNFVIYQITDSEWVRKYINPADFGGR